MQSPGPGCRAVWGGGFVAGCGLGDSAETSGTLSMSSICALSPVNQQGMVKSYKMWSSEGIFLIYTSWGTVSCRAVWFSVSQRILFSSFRPWKKLSESGSQQV